MTAPMPEIDLINPAALHAARWWAETHDHPQPDDRMLAAYGQVIAARAAEQERTKTAEEIALAIEVARGDRCPQCGGITAFKRHRRRMPLWVDMGCGCGHTWSAHMTRDPWIDHAAIARSVGTPVSPAPTGQEQQQ